MALTGTYNVVISAGGIAISESNVTVTGDSAVPPISETLTAGTAVSSWTKTDADTGTATLAEGHGLTSGTYDVYWSGGVQYGCTGTVTDNDLALDGGAGNDFPATSTTGMIVCKQQDFACGFDGDNAVLLGGYCSQRAHVSFKDSGGSVVYALELPAATPWGWQGTAGDGPITGNAIATMSMSCGATTAGNLKFTGLQNAIS